MTTKLAFRLAAVATIMSLTCALTAGTALAGKSKHHRHHKKAHASTSGIKLPMQLTTPVGNFITLYTFDQPTAANPVANANVKICTSAHTPEPTYAYPPFFSVTLATGASSPYTQSASQSPALAITSMTPLQCVQGWVGFDVPGGTKVTDLVYTYKGTPITWKVG